MSEETAADYEYEQQESRKRPLDDQNTDRDRKRTNGGSQSNDGFKKPLLKLLVPNYAAGALIGKGGSSLSELQSKFECSLRVSSNKEYYPGTDERVVVILGEESQLTDLNRHIMEKVQSVQTNANASERHTRDNHHGDDRPQQVKIVLTNEVAGQIIGRGGSTIKAIKEDSKAWMAISNLDDSPVPGERVLKISGSIDQRHEACRQVIEKIAADPVNMANGSTKYKNSTNGGSGGRFGGNVARQNNMQQNDILSTRSNSTSMQKNNLGGLGIGGMSNQTIGGLLSQGGLGNLLGANRIGAFSNQNTGLPNDLLCGLVNQSTKSNFKTTVQIQVEVPDVLVGAVLGKGSQFGEFRKSSGAKLVFSGKNEFAPGTENRILTITGDMNQTQTAYFLVTEKLERIQNDLGKHR